MLDRGTAYSRPSAQFTNEVASEVPYEEAPARGRGGDRARNNFRVGRGYPAPANAGEGARLYATTSLQLDGLLPRRQRWRRVGPFRFFRTICFGLIRHVGLARGRHDWLQLADRAGCLWA